MREVVIKVEPPELMFVDGELIVLLLDKIKLTPATNWIEYYGSSYKLNDGDLIPNGRIVMRKHSKLNAFYDVNENDKIIG